MLLEECVWQGLIRVYNEPKKSDSFGVTHKQARRIMKRAGLRVIFNTDQGCQFTAEAFTAAFDGRSVRISIDGVNRAMDNIYIERFWRTLKYEAIYLNDYRTLTELKAGIKRYMCFYNRERFHASHDNLTPDQM